MSKDKVDLAKQELICPMCMDLFRQPRSLKCLHTYCEECLMGLHRSTGGQRAISCPECRKLTKVDTKGGVEALPLNFKLSNLVKILDVDERNELVTLTRRRKASILMLACPHHPDKHLQCFCESCQTLICIQCVNEHKHHGMISDAVDTLPEHIKALELLLPVAEKAASIGEERLQELGTALDSVRSSGDQAIGSVRGYFSKMRSILERREEEIVLTMTFQMDSRTEEMAKQQKSLQESVLTLHGCKDTISDIVLKRSSDVSVLQEQTAIRNRLRFHADVVKAQSEKLISSNMTQFEDSVIFDPQFEAHCSQVGLIKPQVPPRQRTATSRPAVPKKKQTSQDTVFTPTTSRKENRKSAPIEKSLSTSLSFDLRRQNSVPYESPAPPIRRESIAEILQPYMEISAKLLTGTASPTTRKDVFPHGITVGGDATIVITDSRNSNVRILRSTGKLLELVGPDGISAKLTEPTAVACDHEGYLLVADKSSTSKIVKLSNQGKFVKQFSTRPPLKMTPYLGEPVGLAVDPQGQVYVTDMQEERGGVHVFDGQTGKYLKKFEVATKVVMQAPAGIAIDSDKGRVVVVDKGNHCCWILSSTGELLRKIGGQGHGPGDLHFPFGVAIDKDGKIFISESGNNRISVFTAGGQFIKCLGKKGAEPGMFDHPRHLCFDENQKLLVADEMNQRVQIFKL